MDKLRRDDIGVRLVMDGRRRWAWRHDVHWVQQGELRVIPIMDGCDLRVSDL